MPCKDLDGNTGVLLLNYSKGGRVPDYQYTVIRPYTKVVIPQPCIHGKARGVAIVSTVDSSRLKKAGFCFRRCLSP